MERNLIPVLFIVMEFPPVNTTGNFRSLKFVKYLRQFGIDPIVVTLKESEAASYFNAKIDETLLKELPVETPIYRIHCDDGGKYYSSRFRTFLTIFFSVKDSLAKRWKKNLMREIDWIVSKHEPKVVLTSLPPFSSGMLAVKVSRKYNLPLIVDMRDLYAMWCNAPYGSILHYWLTLAQERRIFKHANKIVGVTPQLIDIFRASHPKIAPSKFTLITNGYDWDGEILKKFEFSSGKKKIVIGYVGSFYYTPESRRQIFEPWWKKRGHKMLKYVPIKEDWLYRSPYFFFKAISQLFLTFPRFQKIISIEFIGHAPQWLSEMIDEFDLKNFVKMNGVVTHQESLSLQNNFDLLLATSERVINGEHYSLPSKIFDYIRLGKPILGFVTPGIQKDFIEQSGLGIICDPDNSRETTEKLNTLIEKGMFFCPNKEYIVSFHRKTLTESLANEIKKLCQVKCD